MTFKLIRFLYQLVVDQKTLEPRRGVFFLLYYATGAWVVFIVATMVLLCLDVYNFPLIRDVLYRNLGEGVLSTLEDMLF